MRRGGVAPYNKFISDTTLRKSPKQDDDEVERAAEAGAAQGHNFNRKNIHWRLALSEY